MRFAPRWKHEATAYRLRQLREEAGYTQRQLADLIGVGQNRVSQIEHGAIGWVTMEALRRYVEATGSELEMVVKMADGTRIPLDF